MIKINMPNYDILIEEKMFKSFFEHIKDIDLNQKFFIITDDHVYDLYEKDILNVFEKRLFHIIKVKPGESSKSLKTYEAVCEKLLNQFIKRDDILIALGGGVIGDLTGFIASTLLRGIDYIQIPTTLLAMVDSSIGGKTGVNLSLGKNLVGTFYQPKMVLIDPLFLDTLSYDEYQNGVAEMIKAGLIGDEALFKTLKNSNLVSISDIHQSILVKKKVVDIDPFDKKERMYLNFGHTFGHAIEKKHGYAFYKHGQAISYGMLMALEIGINLGITESDLYQQVFDMLYERKLIKTPLLTKNDYLDEIWVDKKNLKNGLNFILIKEVGTPQIVTLERDDFK